MMHFVTCITAIAPMRLEPNHRAEMTNQLLLGEGATVIDEQGDFYFLSCNGYSYKGWCQQSQLAIVNSLPETNLFTIDAISTVNINNTIARISAGTPFFTNQLKAKNVEIEYLPCNTVSILQQPITDSALLAIAETYINTPYLWGGRSIFGIDCSGFVQKVYQLLGVQLPRDAYQQATIGVDVGFLEEAICGDLAFFDNEAGIITHVGILINSTTIIHAAAFVKKDVIDHLGITCSFTGKRTHRLRTIKRITTVIS